MKMKSKKTKEKERLQNDTKWALSDQPMHLVGPEGDLDLQRATKGESGGRRGVQLPCPWRCSYRCYRNLT